METPNSSINPVSQVQASQLPPAQDIFRQSWQLYKQHWRKLVSIYLIPYVAIVVLVLIGGGLRLINLSGKWIVHAGTPFLILLAIVMAIAAIYFGIWGEAALITTIKDGPETTSIKEAYKRSSRLVWPLFVVNLLVGLAVLGGFILLIIPGLIFAVWFSQAAYIAITEGLKGTEALSKSRQYLRGRFWPIATKLLFIIIISILLSILVGIIEGVLFSSHNQTAKAVFNGIFNVFWAPLAATYGYYLYTNIKSTAK